ncbi:hypothetical protein HZC07_05160 [Candidatus Micrarchaeota archaeon]|nr:hypothetical protein [Candidatus Micrarchaeota archaeon]
MGILKAAHIGMNLTGMQHWKYYKDNPERATKFLARDVVELADTPGRQMLITHGIETIYDLVTKTRREIADAVGRTEKDRIEKLVQERGLGLGMANEVEDIVLRLLMSKIEDLATAKPKALPTRAGNGLIAAGVTELHQVIQKTEQEVSEMSGIGKTTTEKTKEALNLMGLDFDMPAPDEERIRREVLIATLATNSEDRIARIVRQRPGFAKGQKITHVKDIFAGKWRGDEIERIFRIRFVELVGPFRWLQDAINKGELTEPEVLMASERIIQGGQK